MLSQRQRLEDAVIERLGLELLVARNPAAGYLRAVEPYNGEFDESDGLDELRERLLGRAPAILVSTTGASFRSLATSARRYDRNISLELYPISANIRSRESRVRTDAAGAGGGADPGIYAMLEHVFHALAGEELGVEGVGRLQVTEEAPLLRASDLTAWRVAFSARALLVNSPEEKRRAWTSYAIDTRHMDEDSGEPIPAPPNVEAEGPEE